MPGSGTRMDVVMYLLDALTTFRETAKQEIERITFEIAVLGCSDLDVNDPARECDHKSLPGERSGLQLICIICAA
jgi:hypothetical protein